MKTRFLLPLLASFCLFSGATVASDIPKMIYDKPSLAHVDLTGVEGFSVIELEMQGLIAHRRGDTTIANHFCVIGYQFADRHIEAHVIWKEKNQLIRWWGSREDVEDTPFKWLGSLAASKSIDMNTDLVDEEFTPSTFLVYRPGAEAAVASCEAYGKQYTIAPFFPTDGDGDCIDWVNPEDNLIPYQLQTQSPDTASSRLDVGRRASEHDVQGSSRSPH